MKTTHTILLAAVAAPALWAFIAPRDTVRFEPSSGTTVAKTFKLNSTFALDDMTYLMNGQSPPMMPEMEMDMTVDQTVSVTDTYGDAEDGRPARLTRTFDEIGQELEVEVSVDMMGELQTNSQSGSGTSELEGTTVVFSWNADDEAYDVSFEDGEGDEDLLEGLSEDMDLRRLLPDGDVAEGDEWDVPLNAMIDVLAPGGDMQLEIEMDGADASPMGGPDPGTMTDFRKIMEEMLEGEATGTYVGQREVDGIKVAVIRFSVDISSARDMSDDMGDMSDQMPEGMDVSIDRVDMEFTLEAEGELLWNLESGHAHAFNLSGDASIAMDMAMAMDMGGQSMDMEMSMEMSGTMTHEMSTE